MLTVGRVGVSRKCDARKYLAVTESWQLRAASTQPSQLLHRPISEDGFAVDIAFVDTAEVAAVVRHGAMVAEDEVTIGRHHDFAVRAGVGVIAGNVIFVEGAAVQVDLSVFNADAVAG